MSTTYLKKQYPYVVHKLVYVNSKEKNNKIDDKKHSVNHNSMRNMLSKLLQDFSISKVIADLIANNDKLTLST